MMKRIAVALLLVLIVTILGKSQSRGSDQPIFQQRVAALRPSSGTVPERSIVRLSDGSAHKTFRDSHKDEMIATNSDVVLVNL